MTENVLLSDGALLWTQSTRRPESTGVVFVHGGPGMWDYLSPLAEPLADLVSTHRYDQRGCGRSSASSDYRLARFVADLDELREHFGYRRWFVVGHSFGAAMGVAYASAYPDRVAGLVHCSGVGVDWARHKATYRDRARARLTATQGARRDELQQRDRTWEEEVEWRTLCWLPDFADPVRAETMAREDAVTPLPLNLDCNDALNAETAGRTGDEERAICRGVTSPVLVIHGGEDPRPVTGVEALVDALPAADLITIANAGHQPWREQPDVVNTLLYDFILTNSHLTRV